MAVYLGTSGRIELQRSSIDETFDSVINPSDVNPTKNRFSFDFPAGQLLTGDQLEIKATDGGALDFVAGWGYPDGKWYIHVDEVGGIALYRDFEDAVNGEALNRVDLTLPSRNIPIEIKVANNVARCLGQVTSYELNTARDAVDVTELGEEFHRQYATLISGNGSLDCFFDYKSDPCGVDGVDVYAIEEVVYLHQLVLRQQLGSEFRAQLYLIRRGGNPNEPDDELWYEFDAVVTNVGIAFEPTQPVRSTINFVATGPIELKIRTITNYITQEQDLSGRLAVEYNQGQGYLETEQEE